ncbi:hypothetical protein Tco_1499853 [Tanacetum coccineum]
MNIGTSLQRTQQRLRDTPPNLSTQALQSESSPVAKRKARAKEENPDQRKLTSRIPVGHNSKKNFSPKAVVPGRRIRTTKDIEESNELFRGDTIQRSPGKPKLSMSQKFDSSRSAGSSSTGGEAFKEMVQEELQIEREKSWIF